VLPGGDDPDFVVAIRSLAERTGAQAVISTVAEELVALAEGEDVLRDDGVRAWVPKPEAVQRCTDKLAFAKVLAEAQLATPATALGEDLNVAGPWIVKPRFGRGSRDVYAVDDLNELHWAARRVPEPIVQTRVEGWEFTVDALVERGGSLVGAVPRRRLETKAGISTKGLVFEGPAVVDGAARVLRAIGLAGPANVQGFVGPDDAITFIEVNPRFSGGLPLSLAAGADLVGEYLRGVLGYPLRSERLEFRSGVTMLRHFDEVFEG
jgi:carbamoyl-phosphate synthase large subunit